MDVRVFLRSLAGFAPALALALIALLLAAQREAALSLALSMASIAYTVLRSRCLKRGRIAGEAARVRAVTVPAKPRGRQPFEPFVTCPGCETPSYHLFGPDREVREERVAWSPEPSWEPVMYQIWNKPDTFKVPSERPVLTALTVRVVDRECLQCGTTWEETP